MIDWNIDRCINSIANNTPRYQVLCMSCLFPALPNSVRCLRSSKAWDWEHESKRTKNLMQERAFDDQLFNIRSICAIFGDKTSTSQPSRPQIMLDGFRKALIEAVLCRQQGHRLYGNVTRPKHLHLRGISMDTCFGTYFSMTEVT